MKPQAAAIYNYLARQYPRFVTSTEIIKEAQA